METSILTPSQKYAAAALFGLALHQSQIHQKRPSDPLPFKDKPTVESLSINESVSVSDHSHLWVHENSGLLLPVCSFLGVDEKAWDGLKETAGDSAQLRHHVGAFLKMLSEESDGTSSERTEKELALTKSVDSMVLSMEASSVSSDETCGKSEYGINKESEYGINKESSNDKTESNSDVAAEPYKTNQGTSSKMSDEEKSPSGSGSGASEQPLEEGMLITYQRKVTVLYELLSACLADNVDVDKKYSRRKGYDTRHRTALRLLSTWLNIKWIKMEAIEVTVACSLVTSVQEQGKKEDENVTTEDPSEKWKRGGIIGAAAITGGTLLAVTGGLAAPAIAHGLGALGPTVGSLVPGIGAGGFAAAASATGSVTGSVAIAASFGAAGAGLTGSKMAKRIGNLDEFEFKVIGENHNQGRLAVGIMISGLVFEEEDFVKPWEVHSDNAERYALQWESNNLTALSTAIQDWLTSKLAGELMKDGAMLTVLSSLLAALATPATLLSAADIIDSKWAVGVDRSNKAGKLLAEVLLNGLQGNRPVTLIGFSLGARVVFKCLECLAEKGDNAGLVERVVLLGAPVPIKDEKWEDARKMVSGRFINAYSTKDWTLGIAFRASLLSEGLAGIQPVNVPGIQNIDVTEVIEGHSSYLWMTKQILDNLDLDSYYPVFKAVQHLKPQF